MLVGIKPAGRLLFGERHPMNHILVPRCLLESSIKVDGDNGSLRTQKDPDLFAHGLRLDHSGGTDQDEDGAAQDLLPDLFGDLRPRSCVDLIEEADVFPEPGCQRGRVVTRVGPRVRDENVITYEEPVERLPEPWFGRSVDIVRPGSSRPVQDIIAAGLRHRNDGCILVLA